MRFAVWTGMSLALLFVQPATATTVRETLEQFGFMGRWASLCSRPAAPDNTIRTVEINTNEVSFVERFGDDYEPNVYTVVQATQEKKDTLILRVELGGNGTQELTMQRHGNRIRTTLNRGKNGTLVKNGIVIATGRPTAWLTHCDDAH
ncbi:MAG: hypothetical protein JO237_08775 [Pseudolabrys sp.]|nr:hypothetical protein [Pseudolabrys sp.]